VSSGVRIDLPELVTRVLEDGQHVQAHVFNGFWLDIGRPADYSLAVQYCDHLRPALLHEEGVDIEALQSKVVLTTL